MEFFEGFLCIGSHGPMKGSLQHSDAGLITTRGSSGNHTKQWHDHDKTNTSFLALRTDCDDRIDDVGTSSDLSSTNSSV